MHLANRGSFRVVAVLFLLFLFNHCWISTIEPSGTNPKRKMIENSQYCASHVYYGRKGVTTPHLLSCLGMIVEHTSWRRARSFAQWFYFFVHICMLAYCKVLLNRKRKKKKTVVTLETLFLDWVKHSHLFLKMSKVSTLHNHKKEHNIQLIHINIKERIYFHIIYILKGKYPYHSAKILSIWTTACRF